MAPEYPWYTLYQFAGNTPIQASELEGLEPEGKVKYEGQVVTLPHGTDRESGEPLEQTWIGHAGTEENNLQDARWMTPDQYEAFMTNRILRRSEQAIKLGPGHRPAYKIAPIKELCLKTTGIGGKFFDVYAKTYVKFSKEEHYSQGMKNMDLELLLTAETGVGLYKLARWGLKAGLKSGASVADEVVEAAETSTQLFRSGISQYKNTGLTNAGRAVTKHPQYFGFESTEALMKVHNTPAALNKLGSQSLEDILRNGVRTTGAGGRYPNGWITYTLKNGNAASWTSDGVFIGFRGIR